MPDLAVVDAHALIWYGLRRWQRLGKRARGILERAEAGKATLYVPTIVLVEIGELVRLGRITLEGGFDGWTGGLFAQGGFFPADLTIEIVLEAQRLHAIQERGDRLIAATAVVRACPLVTRNRRIEAVAGVGTIW